MPKDNLHFDDETFSKVNLKVEGLSRYMRHPSTELLMRAYSFNDGPVRQWVPAEGERCPRELSEALDDPDVIKHAWNATFEWNSTFHLLGIDIPFEQIRCSMVEAQSLSFPGKLEDAGHALDIPKDKKKMSRGSALVRKFTMPRKPTKNKPHTRATMITDPEDWEEFKEYNRQDVEAERFIHNKVKRWTLPPEEWELYALDHEINELGIPINLAMVDNAIEIIAHMRAWRLKAMRKMTGCENPNSNKQLLPWLKDQGYPFNDMKKGHVQRALEDWRESDGKKLKRVLQLRLDVAKTSVNKYSAYADRTDDDGYYRNAVQYMGAGRTGRWSGRGVQVHNLLRPVAWLEDKRAIHNAVEILENADPYMFETIYDEPYDVLGACVRPAIKAPEGYLFVDADLNAIENRVLGYIADEQKILDVFRHKRDPYIDFATYMYDEDYEVLYHEWKVLKVKGKRQIAKPGVLGCGYMLGAGDEFENEQTGEIEATGLLGYAWNMGVKMTHKEAKHSVKIWRKTYDGVVDFWKEIDRAMRKCIKTGNRTYCGVLEFDMSGPFIRMRLPSGRYLYYYKPKILMRKTPWGELKATITYMNQNDSGQWVRVSTHPGKITENADQAIARDVLAHGIIKAKQRGLDVRLHVHDQVVAMSKEDKAERELKILIECMAEPPRWSGNALPLDAAGTISRIFLKD